jgi:predicted enzyme related to lactoylglutathione lyase
MDSTFVWYELMTRDPGAAAAFYGELLGWTARDSGQADLDYRLFEAAGAGVAGVMEIPSVAAAAGMPPRWFPYVSVSNLDQAVARFVGAGGSVHSAAISIPNVGRIAMVADPQGALLNLIAPVGDGPATSFAPGKSGHGGWHELHATHAEAALAFYAEQFGWTKSGAIPMGAHGMYHLFGVGGGPAIGGVMTDLDLKRPAWLIVFNVDGAQAARDRAIANGGTAITPTVQVATGEWVAHLQDPQGARFGIVSRRR